MMKRFMNNLLIAALLMLGSLAQAKAGLLFKITELGTPVSVDVILCLNGKGSLSCQNYHVSAQNLAIRTAAKHTYPFAGIKVLTPGYKATGCAPYSKDYCLFAANGTAATSITLQKTFDFSYTVGGQVNGLTGTLVLENNGNDSITMNADGSFTFPSVLADSSSYVVTVQTQPATQTCTVSNGSGTISGLDVRNVHVSCSANTHTVGGSVSGLANAESIILQNNGGDNLTLSANGGFTFTTPIAQGATYNVTVLTQPSTQTCTVTQGSGTVSTTNITNVQVTCSTNTYTVGGTISGLIGTVILQNNGADNSTITSDGSFVFSTPVANGATYTVTVLTQPSGQTCSLSNGSGTISGGNVNNVALDCVNNTTLTSSVSTLALSVSGVARVITIENIGSNAATNLVVLPPTWPSGTTNSTTCTSMLAAGNTCTITVIPGSTATSDGTNPCSSGTAPVAGTVTVSADNASTVSTDVVVLNYGCIYQGGYIFALDDTTATSSSVGGKVLATSDQAPRYNSGVVWSSNGAGSVSANVSYDIIPGIGETSGTPIYSTAQSRFNLTYSNEATHPFPVSGSFSSCSGATDGACNSTNILTLYNMYKTNYGIGGSPYTLSTEPTISSYYAAGLCSQTIATYSDWYLPAICEMGPAANGSGCASNIPNIVTNLPGLLSSNASNADNHVCILGGGCLFGVYWSSTEYSTFPLDGVWYQYFASSGSTQYYRGKESQVGVRCVRALTF